MKSTMQHLGPNDITSVTHILDHNTRSIHDSNISNNNNWQFHTTWFSNILEPITATNPYTILGLIILLRTMFLRRILLIRTFSSDLREAMLKT